MQCFIKCTGEGSEVRAPPTKHKHETGLERAQEVSNRNQTRLENRAPQRR